MLRRFLGRLAATSEVCAAARARRLRGTFHYRVHLILADARLSPVGTACCAAAIAAAAGLHASSEASLAEAAPKKRGLATQLTEGLPTVRFLTKTHVERTVTLLNAIIDLPSFSDDEEQLILTHAVYLVVAAVERALPRTFLSLAQNGSSDEGLEPGQAALLKARLMEVVRATCTLPYLAPKEESQLVQCVVSLAVASMARGASYDDVLDVDVAGPILMECFIKGNAGR